MLSSQADCLTLADLALARQSDHERRAVEAFLWRGERADAEAVLTRPAHVRRHDEATQPTRLRVLLKRTRVHQQQDLAVQHKKCMTSCN